MLDLMKSAGLDTISMGVQSADATVLQNINRRKEETQLCCELIQEAKSRQILTATKYDIWASGGVRTKHTDFY